MHHFNIFDHLLLIMNIDKNINKVDNMIVRFDMVNHI